MADYKPGTVAMVTTRRRDEEFEVGRERLAFYDGYNHRWVSANSGALSSDEEAFQHDVRPLVVLDLDRLVEAQTLANFLRLQGICGSRAVGDALAEQIEAQTKPARIPEPGLWGVVEAKRQEFDGTTDRAAGKWFRTDSMVCPWTHFSGEYTAEWDDLIDPVLIREGVE